MLLDLITCIISGDQYRPFSSTFLHSPVVMSKAFGVNDS
jgi:hypothetical protein